MRLHFDADLWFAEKTPRNCFLIPFLGKAFPTARFIYITRDGRDVALSYSKQPWLQQASISSGKREPGGYAYGTDPRFWVEPNRLGEFESTTDIHRCIWAWRRHVEAAELGLAHIAPSRQYRLRYEQLVQYPHEEADRLLDFLSIDDPASQSIFQRAVAQARPDSLGNWKRDLSEESLGMIMHEAGALLSQLQYT